MLGNAAAIRDKMPPLAYGTWKKQYGNIFRAFIGLQPVVVISGAVSGLEQPCAAFQGFVNALTLSD